MSTRYLAAAIQFAPQLGAKEANINTLLCLCQSALRTGARLLVLPEMATTGYCWYSREEIAPYVETIPGPTTERFAALARIHQVYLVVGMPEVDPFTHAFYNTAVLIGPTGLIGIYRKVHSFISEPKWAKDGDLGFKVWDTELGRIGMLICMDVDFPEAARLLAVHGVDVICFPTNWLLEKAPGAVWLARAVENGCYLIAADRYGFERGIQFSGGSSIIEPSGRVQSRLDVGDGFVLGEIDLTEVCDQSNPFSQVALLDARQPEFYDNLTLNTYLWEPREFFSLYHHDPLPEGQQSTVAVLQFIPRPGDFQANLQAIEQLLKGLPPGTDLVVTPEYALTGFSSHCSEIRNLALTDRKAAVAALLQLAARYKTMIVAGFLEIVNDSLMSAAVLVDGKQIRVSYHKIHFLGEERNNMRAGANLPPVVNTSIGRIGLLIGSDLYFPEIVRRLAIAGCDLIAVPAGPSLPSVQALEATQVPLPSPAITGYDSSHFHLARVRANENNTYIAYAALPEPWGTGWSGIFGPTPEYRSAERLLGPTDEGVTWGVIDTGERTEGAANPVREKPLVRARRVDWYAALQRRR